MKAILSRDKVIKFTIDKQGIEVGDLPSRNIGLSRLRFNGRRLIDVLTLSEFWVTRQFSLHVVEVPGSQKVKMFYRDKYRLINDNGTIRLKTDQEIENEEEKLVKEITRHRAQRKLKKESQDNSITTTIIRAIVERDKNSIKMLKNYLKEIN